MRRKKEDYFVVGLALTLLFVVFGIAGVLIHNANNRQIPDSSKISLSPTQASTTSPSSAITPGSTDPNSEPQLKIDIDAQDRLLDRVNTRKTLSQPDIKAVTDIRDLLPVGERSGILSDTPNIRIEYVSSADLFMVEILTIDVGAAKNEANVWFRNHGMTQDAICNYPVMFYLNSDVLTRIKELKITFSPVGNGC